MNKLLKQMLQGFRKLPLRIDSKFDNEFLVSDVPVAKNISHQKWQKYLYQVGNKSGMRVLEVDSREVTKCLESIRPSRYVGFDHYPGNNVYIVGNAHKQSSYFKDREQFDIINSSAYFEHFAMPWSSLSRWRNFLKWVALFLWKRIFRFHYMKDHGTSFNIAIWH